MIKTVAYNEGWTERMASYLNTGPVLVGWCKVVTTDGLILRFSEKDGVAALENGQKIPVLNLKHGMRIQFSPL